MNLNEVVANRAAELPGPPARPRPVHPNDDVNPGQSEMIHPAGS